MSLHSILSPSAHDRWGNCAGALAACKGIPEKRSSEAAARGTAKHAISEQCLRAKIEPASFLGKDVVVDGFTFEIDETFADQVQVYVDYCRSRPGYKHYEVRLSTETIFGVRGQGGTSDCIHLDYSIQEIEVIDAKFGYVPVSVKHKQLRDYGAAAMILYDLEDEWKTVRCTIVQPQDDPPVKSAVYTRAEIEAYILEEQPKAQLAFKLWEKPPVDLQRYLTPSDEACAWCPIAGACIARAERIVNMFEAVTAQTPDVVLLSNERLAELRAQVGDILEWAGAIDAEALTRALAGQAIPGNKLIYGRKGPRAYKPDVQTAVEGVLSMALGEDKMYQPRKLVSPTQAEAALKAANAPALYEQLKPYVTQAEPSLKLVPESAKGEAVSVTSVAEQFGVVA